MLLLRSNGFFIGSAKLNTKGALALVWPVRRYANLNVVWGWVVKHCANSKHEYFPTYPRTTAFRTVVPTVPTLDSDVNARILIGLLRTSSCQCGTLVLLGCPWIEA